MLYFVCYNENIFHMFLFSHLISTLGLKYSQLDYTTTHPLKPGPRQLVH